MSVDERKGECGKSENGRWESGKQKAESGKSRSGGLMAFQGGLIGSRADRVIREYQDNRRGVL